MNVSTINFGASKKVTLSNNNFQTVEIPQKSSV